MVDRSARCRVPFHIPDVQASLNKARWSHRVSRDHTEVAMSLADPEEQHHLGSDLHVSGCVTRIRKLCRSTLLAWLLRRGCIPGLCDYNVDMVSEE